MLFDLVHHSLQRLKVSKHSYQLFTVVTSSQLYRVGLVVEVLGWVDFD